MSYYERHLPHWHPAEKTLFVTWRLYGSLPAHFWGTLEEKPQPGEARVHQTGKRFRTIDCELDKAASGPVWLKDSRIAKCVVDALRFGEAQLKLYELHAYVVMANHVHLLLQPRAPLARITRVLKGFTAREANRILARTGQRFWQGESFDRWVVRNAAELERITSYIERNPVSAGLVAKPDDWPWSSARKRQ